METSVKSTDWEWRKNDISLVPIMTDKDPAPIDLLKFIPCNCKLTTTNPCSSNICTCRKHGLSYKYVKNCLKSIKKYIFVIFLYFLSSASFLLTT